MFENCRSCFATEQFVDIKLGVKNDETDKRDPRPAGRGLYNRI